MSKEHLNAYESVDEVFKILEELPTSRKKTNCRMRLLTPSTFVISLSLLVGCVAYTVGSNGYPEVALFIGFIILLSWIAVIPLSIVRMVKTEARSPVCVLRERFEREKRVIVQLLEMSAMSLALAKGRIEAQRECFEPRAAATDAIPKIFAAGGVLIVATGNLELFKVLFHNSSLPGGAVALGAYILSLLVLAMEWANYTTGQEVAKLREFECYLEASLTMKRSGNGRVGVE